MRDLPCVNTAYLNEHLRREEEAHNECPDCPICDEKMWEEHVVEGMDEPICDECSGYCEDCDKKFAKKDLNEEGLCEGCAAKEVEDENTD